MGMNSLLSTDWHLTDNPIEEYRWEVFNLLQELAEQHNVKRIYCLGDLWDRKDRHSAKLLNRTVQAFQTLHDETGAEIYILMGNHDCPLIGTPYWSFMNELGIHYVTEPILLNGIWLLPFSSNPKDEWKELKLYDSHAIFMHQTVVGSQIEGDRVIDTEPHPMPLLPRGIPVYSGDVHRPQVVGGVIYVGVPHPTRFGESWPNRVVLIKQGDFRHPQFIAVRTIRRLVVEIEQVQQLDTYQLRAGDQVRVRYKLNNAEMMQWATREAAILDWASRKSIVIVSIEAILMQDMEDSDSTSQQIDGDFGLLSPEATIRSFSADEGLGDDVMQCGLALLKEAQACAN